MTFFRFFHLHHRYFLLASLLMFLVGCESVPHLSPFPSFNKTQQTPDQRADAIVAAAEDALFSVSGDDQVGQFFVKEFQRDDVVGVIITPALIKGGLFVGGSGGNGVLLARADNGEWSYPSFVLQGGGSFGVQIGFKTSKVVSVITSREQLEVMLRGSPIAGGQAGGTVVDEGASFDVSGGLDVTSALRSFAVNRGAFVGADIKLGGLWTDAALNAAFYGSSQATPQDIVLRAQYQNAKADGLRNLLTRLSR